MEGPRHGRCDHSRRRGTTRSGWAVGWTYFASILMVLIGVFHAIAGLVAILDDQFYVATRKYVFQFDVTQWGWIHLILGVVVALSGLYLLTGSVFARTIGVIMALGSAITGFAWLPYEPVWGVLIVAMAVAVIWALTVHGRDVTEPAADASADHHGSTRRRPSNPTGEPHGQGSAVPLHRHLPSEAAARADYDLVKDLHAIDVVGSYDAAVVTKDDSGKVHVNKDEMATRHGGWGGAAPVPSSASCSRPRSSAQLWSAVPSERSAATSGEASHARRKSMRRGALLVWGQQAGGGLDQANLQAEKHIAKQLDVSTSDVDAAGQGRRLRGQLSPRASCRAGAVGRSGEHRP